MLASNLIRAFFLAMLLCSASAFAERVSILKDTQLREEPNVDSLHVSTVQRGATGVAMEKKGPWFRVDVNGRMGWILITEFIFSPVGNPQVPRQSVAGATATLGVRCFCSPWEMTFRSEVSEEQLALLDSYAVSMENTARPDESLPVISTK